MDGIRLAEKALKIFCKLNDNFELARAYWIAGGYYGFSEYFVEEEDKTISLYKKSKDLLQKALELSKEIDDASLIGHCYEASWGYAQFLSDPKLAVENGEKTIKYGNITQDNYLIAKGNILASLSVVHLSRNMEDPDKQKAGFKKAVKMSQQARHHFNIINELPGLDVTYMINGMGLQGLAEINTSIEKKQALLEESLRVNQEGLDKLSYWDRLRMYLFVGLTESLISLSELKPVIEEKRKLLTEARIHQEKSIKFTEKFVPFMFSYNSLGFYSLALILSKLANLEDQDTRKVEMLNQAATSIKKSLELLQKKLKMVQSGWASGTFFAKYYFKLGGIIQEIVTLTKEDNRITEAIEAYENASSYFRKAKMPTRIAESNWSIAQLYDQLNNHQESSKNYELSAQSFVTAARNIPQLEQFYNEYSVYMQAWSQVEQARYSHSIEDYEEAQQRYKEAVR